MAKPLRIEFANAWYHVTSRGDEREVIVLDVMLLYSPPMRLIAVLTRNEHCPPRVHVGTAMWDSVPVAEKVIEFEKGAAPGYEFDANKIITKLTGPIPTLSATIQTFYISDAKPTDPSAYGRGTTSEDKSNGNTTLGFHESCHRQDYQDFIKNNALLKFEGRVGMTEQQYKDTMQRYPKAVDAYLAKAMKYSKDKTDEVGSPTRSQYMAQKKP